MRRHGRKGLTGIQTAIILIAFVIVASVFAFAVLNMGLLTTQRAGETVSAGMQQATSALQLAGSVIAYSSAEGYVADKIIIYIKISPGREPVDLSQAAFTIAFTNDRVHASNIYDGTKAAITFITGDGDHMLEYDETAKVEVNLGEISTEDVADEDVSITGSGQGPYSGTLSKAPVKPGSVTITITYTSGGSSVTDTFTDDGKGNLVDTTTSEDKGGINYATGYFEVTLSSAPDSGSEPSTATADYTYAPALLARNEWFKVELVPSTGATLSVERYLPATIDAVMDLG